MENIVTMMCYMLYVYTQILQIEFYIKYFILLNVEFGIEILFNSIKF